MSITTWAAQTRSERLTGLPVRSLGRTDIAVAVLGFGSMELRGPPRGRELDDAHVGALLNRLLDRGINLIDTSIDYGIAEERIGRHIPHRRDEYFLATKCGCLVGWTPSTPDERSPHDYSRTNVVGGVEQSLRRLRTDHLDLLQVHVSPSRSRLEREDVVATMASLRDAGKVRFLGMSGTLPNLPDQIDMGVFDVFQVPYSLLQREHEDLISLAAGAGSGVIVRGGAGKGAPSGEPGPTERYAKLAETWSRLDLADLLDGMDPMEFTLRFTISHPAVSSTIVGTTSLDHLDQNLAAVVKGPLPADLYERTKQRLDQLGTSV